MFENRTDARLAHRVGAVLLGVAVALLPMAPAATAPPRAPAVVDLVSGPLTALRAGQSELLLRSLINAERAAANRRGLRMQKKLIKIARRHSRRMASAGSIYHNPRLARQVRRLSWSIAGENVGVGNAIESLHAAFMASPPHRENVMRSQYRRVGIGVLQRDGRIWVTVVFLG
jgi:uncharacterized protein YkwD